AIKRTQPKWRLVVSTAIKFGVPVPAFSASLAYYDSYRSARLPANLLQAQRDFFGAHTYERIDKPGVFHAEWLESEEKPERPAGAENTRAASRGRVVGAFGISSGARRWPRLAVAVGPDLWQTFAFMLPGRFDTTV